MSRLFHLFVGFVFASATHAADFKPQAGETIVCIGDSITAMNIYAPMMQDLINQAYPARGIVVVNRGVSGDTAKGALGRLDGDLAGLEPDWVLLNFGMNDQQKRTVDEFIADNEALIQHILSTTTAQPVLVSTICNDYVRDGKPTRLDEYAAALRELAGRRKLVYAPLNEASNRIKMALPAGIPLAPDGIHPNRIGYWIYAQTILTALGFPASSTPIVESVPVNLMSGDQQQLAAGQEVRLDLPSPIVLTLVPTPAFTATARHAAKPVVIDGGFDEWDLSAPLALASDRDLLGQAMSWGKAGLDARAWQSWDDHGLNLAFRVVDAAVVNRDQVAFVVDRDCIEVCLDLRPAAERAGAPAIAFGDRTARTGQYIISPATAGMAAARCDMGNGPKDLLAGVTVATRLTEDGYQMELRIPKALLPDGGPTAGQAVGFDWAVIDVPATAQYHHARSRRWTGSLFGWRSTRDFALLTFAP